MTELNIVPECYVDTKVAEIVGRARKYNHQHGCGNVANELKNKLKDNIALGIVDEDKNKGAVSKYFVEFNIVKTENNLVLKKHKERKHYLVLVCPEMEEWLLNDGKAVGIAPSDFDLPKDLKGFKQISKIQDIDKNIGFHQFIKRLLQENAPAITTLKSWIDLFNVGNLDSVREE
jgi:hypothetical protein